MPRARKQRHTAVKLMWLGVILCGALMVWGMRPFESMVVGLSLPAFVCGMSWFHTREHPYFVVFLVSSAGMAAYLLAIANR